MLVVCMVKWDAANRGTLGPMETLLERDAFQKNFEPGPSKHIGWMRALQAGPGAVTPVWKPHNDIIARIGGIRTWVCQGCHKRSDGTLWR